MSEKISIAIPVAAGRMVSIQWAFGFKYLTSPVPTVFQFVQGLPVDHARNHLVQMAFETKASHIFFLDDDVIPPPDILLRLWRHWKNQKLPILAGHYGLKSGRSGILVDDGGSHKSIEVHGKNKLVTGPKLATGLGCCLIHMDVFRKLSKPYFFFEYDEKNDLKSEDVIFFARAREAGFPLNIDNSIRCAHVDFTMRDYSGQMYDLNPNNIEASWGDFSYGNSWSVGK